MNRNSLMSTMKMMQVNMIRLKNQMLGFMADFEIVQFDIVYLVNRKIMSDVKTPLKHQYIKFLYLVS